MREEIRKRAEMIRRGDVPEGYKKTKVGIIPEDWELEAIKNVSEIINGGTPSTINPEYWGDEILWCTPTDITKCKTKYLFKTERGISKKGLKNSSATLVPKGSLLLCSRATIGEVRIASNEISTNQGFKSLVCKKDCYNEFLYYLISSSHVKKQLKQKAIGSTFLEISKKDISKFLIVFPSLQEQTAIAQILSTSDKAIETTETLINLKEQKKKWLMQNLLTRKVRLRGFKGEWNKLRLGEVATFSKGKGLSKNQISPKGKTPCIHYGELFTFYPEIINVIASYTDISKNMVYSQKNDVLMPTSDVTPNGLAKASSIMLDKVIIGGDILIIKPNRNIVFGPFLSYHIRESRNVILRLVSGITVYHLYAKDMKKYPLFIPEYDEQQAIANVLTTADKEIDLLNKKLDTLKQQKKALMQLLLTGIVRTTGLNLSSDTEEEGVAYVQ